ncbi:hypothetical protein [Cupriavidus sp. AU9028]|uniref:hypothetical protein n=1 Tax=Cupriavidus sp. AU9028 TaxID=2871157 RepID=UPI001C95D114|nr:hypothetical protein [Cupriavidus sp. AU9028]MBY4895897.1 hypothetical protein [Cupriavidus sp. AU9028]
MKRNRMAWLASLLLPMLCAGPASGQQADTAAQAISDAVRSGETPYRPLPAEAVEAGALESEECRSLRERIAVAPTREYQANGPEIEDSQGTTFPGLTRERPRRELERAYRDNCLR